MTGYVYKIVNIVNNKCYVGQTVRSVSQRFKEHFHPSANCLYLKNSILKYGKENFKVEVLETINCESKKELVGILNQLEIKYINNNNSLAPNGYNGCLGGGNSVDRKWAQGMSPESIVKRAEKHKKSIKCNETGQIWPSIKECADSFGVKPESIHRVLRGVRDHFKNMSFSYVNPEKSKPKKIRKKRVRSLDSYNLTGLFKQVEAQKRSIKCNETGEIWNSIQEAAKHFEVKNETIHRVLRGNRKSFRNFTFSYL